MALDPAALLAGPRGRRVCLELLMGDVWSTERDDASTAVFWATHALDPNPGTLITIGDGPAPAPPVVSAANAASVLDTVPVPVPTAPSLRRAVAASVDRAMYWQQPDGSDVLAATDVLAPVLARVADVVAASADAAWWDSPAALGDQWAVGWDGAAVPRDDPAAILAAWARDAHDEEERAARERPSDPRANWSGTWWSTPPAGLVHSTRDLRGDGPAELWWHEDSFGWQAATATPVLPPSGSVLEIDGVDAWRALCLRHPLEVTASRRHDWFRVTGWEGAWVQPDWRSVAGEADGVHLSVAGYLEAATRLIDLGDGRASVIAGWAPDATYWFARTLAGEPEVPWTCDDEGWRRA